MSSRLLSGAGALVIIVAAGHALAAAEDQRFRPVAKPQKAAIGKPPAPRFAALGATVESVLAAGRQLNPALLAAALDTATAAAKAAGADALDDPMISDSYQHYRNPNVFSGRAITVTRGMRAAGEARYAAGQGDQAAVIKALGEETVVEIEAARLEGDRAAARELLNALLARPAGAPLAEPSRPRRVPAVNLSTASLVERARGGSPALAASGAEVDAARTRAALAEKACYPDLTVGAGQLIQTNKRP
jgi:hypothetical protein